MTGDTPDKPKPRTLGQAIDTIVEALRDLDDLSRVGAIRAACEHLTVALPSKLAARESASLDASARPDSSPVIDIRALKDAKKPSSANEMAALVAYYLQEIAVPPERKTAVDVSDMQKYFKQANFKLPRVPRVILGNAKTAGYFESAGSGQYRLNPVGYNLVVHNLPRGTAPLSELGAGRRRRKTRRPARKAK